jgi:hypothetical protein
MIGGAAVIGGCVNRMTQTEARAASQPTAKDALPLVIPQGIEMMTAKTEGIDSTQFIETFSTPDQRDYYTNPPLRVGTQGSNIYHRTFCPYAKRALDLHGFDKRVDFWTRAEVANSNREPCTYCSPQEFNCCVPPIDFVQQPVDPLCGTSVMQLLDHPELLDLGGKYLCKLDGYIGQFSETDEDCNSNGTAEPGSIVTLAAFNAIVNKKGDANRDGDCDDDDFPYFNACFGEDGEAASEACASAFDYDSDGDVDQADFIMFQESLFSGNSYWICKSGLKATNSVINPVRPMPLMVGTEGSNYYHRPDSPVVLSSWERHGIEKRIDFYTWEQIEASGRIPGDAPTQEEWEQESEDCTTKRERCSIDPFEMTGPGGLGDVPKHPTVKIDSIHDLDQDGDVDMKDHAIFQSTGVWEPDPRFGKEVELMINTDIMVDENSGVILENIYEGDDRVLTGRVDETAFSWVWRSWERCASNSRWTHRNSLMHGKLFDEMSEASRNYYASKAEGWKIVDVTSLPRPDVWPGEMTIKELFRYGLYSDINATYQGDSIESIALDGDGYKLFGSAWDVLGLVISYDTLIQIEVLPIPLSPVEPLGESMGPFGPTKMFSTTQPTTQPTARVLTPSWGGLYARKQISTKRVKYHLHRDSCRFLRLNREVETFDGKEVSHAWGTARRGETIKTR